MPVTRRAFFQTAASVAGVASTFAAPNRKRPNIVLILADDLGYGDVHFLNPQRGKIPTPRLDRLATESMSFTDAHSADAVCTPSRYAILTGRYAWRSPLQKGVLLPYDSPLIPSSRLTLPAMLRQHGYRTACVGKWHLGWNWPRRNGAFAFDQPILNGPTTLGFDSYFGTDVPNYPPYCFIENDRTVGIPSVPKPKEVYGTDGIMLSGWRLDRILPSLAEHACDFIQTSSQTKDPFFLYLPLTSPHTPLAVAESWKNKSGLGLYGDWVMQTDDVAGQVLDAIDKAGVRDNTLVLFASDNGCAPYIGLDYEGENTRMGRVKELEAKGHFPSANFRGYKSDIWEGGHRVPFFARWPGMIQPGSTCAATVCYSDLMATCAAMLGAHLPQNAAEDSVNILPLLTGSAHNTLREATVHHSINGKFAIRQGRWKLAFCAGSGGWTEPTDKTAARQNLPEIQLYDMEQDPAETNNLHGQQPQEVSRLTRLMEQYVANGRSTPGPSQKNDATVMFRTTSEPREKAIDP